MFDIGTIFPYSDLHKLNLDWILQTVKSLSTQWDETKTDWENTREFINNYFNNLDVQKEIDNKLEKMLNDGDFDITFKDLFIGYMQAINNISAEVSQLSSRMDEFTSLADGSTTGDAELQDIRVWFNGITSNNAGDAVRGQITQALNKIDIIDSAFVNSGSYVHKSGNIIIGNSGWTRTNNIYIYNCKKITILGTFTTDDSVANIAIFNTRNEYMSEIEASSNGITDIDLPQNANYIVLSTAVNPTPKNMTIIITEKYDYDLKQLELKWESGKYVNLRGVITGNMQWSLCRLYVNNNFYIKGYFNDSEKSACGIAAFDKNDEFISNLGNNLIDEFIEIPEGTYSIIISRQTAETSFPVYGYFDNVEVSTDKIYNNAYNIIDPRRVGNHILIPNYVTILDGISQSKCILNASVTYDNPLLFIGGGVVKNMVFMSEHFISGYLVHSENIVSSQGLRFENCRFIGNSIGNLVGIGMYPGTRVSFVNCIFEKPTDGPCGYFHDCTTLNGSYELEFINCTFHNNRNYILGLESNARSTSSINIRFVNNYFYNNGGDITFGTSNTAISNGVPDFLGLNNWHLTRDSRGNNVDFCNYNN